MSSQHQDLWCSGRYWTRARSQPLSIRADRWARFTRALLCRICARYSSASLGTPFGFRPTLLRGPTLLSYDFKPQPFSLSELTTNLPSFHSFWLPAQCVHSGCAFVQTHGPTTTSTSEEIHPKFLKVDPSLFVSPFLLYRSHMLDRVHDGKTKWLPFWVTALCIPPLSG